MLLIQQIQLGNLLDGQYSFSVYIRFNANLPGNRKQKLPRGVLNSQQYGLEQLACEKNQSHR